MVNKIFKKKSVDEQITEDELLTIIDEIEDEIVGLFESALKDIDFKKCIQDPYIIFEKLTAIINRDMDFYGHLLNMNTNANLISKISVSLKAEVKKSFSSQIE